MQSFDQRMDHKELRDTGGALAGAEANDATKGATQTYWNASRRSDKHAALQDNADGEIELSTHTIFFVCARPTLACRIGLGEKLPKTAGFKRNGQAEGELRHAT